MSSGYITLTRQSGLFSELQIVANNIANISTTGFRKEGTLFSEFVQALDDPAGSVSMGTARVRETSMEHGPVVHTGGKLDVAIEGDGFFLVETPRGERLTRAGSFAQNEAGELVSLDGHRVLDAGGAPIFVPPDAAVVGIAPDGTISTNGQPISQIGLFEPVDSLTLTRETGQLFASRRWHSTGYRTTNAPGFT